MNQVFNKEGFRALRVSWALLVVSIAAGAGIIAASHWYAQKEKRDRADSGRRLQEAHLRVEAARRERLSLQESSDVFRTLLARGVLQPAGSGAKDATNEAGTNEKRLDVIELVNSLRARHQLLALDYEIAPQRTLVLPAGRSYPAVDVLSSRVRLKARALHEGDLVGLIDGLEKNQQGFYLPDHCTMRALDVSDASSLQPRVEAECTLEWITLREKRGNRPS